ncbi:MAG TPA: nuclear transport factor 2 family protein [Blastocatellia bacterium]|nr:nuclear transport factor 2 family protein [Blastocatellia bacterium]
MRRVVSLFVTAAVSTAICAQARAGEGSLAAVVAAERKFAAASVATSTRDAFLANLGEDSILFRPYAVPGRQWTESHPGGNGLLTWEPTFAMVSQSGDMGVTSGPWEYRKGRAQDETPIAFGHFSTVWRLNDDGVWRVAIDCGVSHAKPESAEALVLDPSATHTLSAGKASAVSTSARDSLLGSEAAFTALAGASGPDAAYVQFLGDAARVYRDDKMPAVGRRSALDLVKADGAAVHWSADGAVTSKFGDLGFTYGRGERPAAKTGVVEHFTFLRVWQRAGSGEWKIALEVVNGVPAEEAKD